MWVGHPICCVIGNHHWKKENYVTEKGKTSFKPQLWLKPLANKTARIPASLVMASGFSPSLAMGLWFHRTLTTNPSSGKGHVPTPLCKHSAPSFISSDYNIISLKADSEPPCNPWIRRERTGKRKHYEQPFEMELESHPDTKI